MSDDNSYEFISAFNNEKYRKLSCFLRLEILKTRENFAKLILPRPLSAHSSCRVSDLCRCQSKINTLNRNLFEG